MDPIALLVRALLGGLLQVATRLAEKAVVDPALEPATKLLKKWVQRGVKNAEQDKGLRAAIRSALAAAGAPVEKDDDDLLRWLQRVGLDVLSAKPNQALRAQVARAVLAFCERDPIRYRHIVYELRSPCPQWTATSSRRSSSISLAAGAAWAAASSPSRRRTSSRAAACRPTGPAAVSPADRTCSTC